MTESKLCGECGAEIPSDSIFCEICGARLAKGSSDVDSAFTKETDFPVSELEASKTSMQLEPTVIIPQQFSAKRTRGRVYRLILLAIICFAPLFGLSFYFFTPSIATPYFVTNSSVVMKTTTYSRTSTTFSYVTTLTTPCQYCLYVHVTRTIASSATQMTMATSSYTNFSTNSGVNVLSPASVRREETTTSLIVAIAIAAAAFLLSCRKWGTGQLSTD